ncbi:MAG TPA: Gfo/Idh/MocA family oxidoreductase [Candidatus Aerophobetes bacterium]|uniref:Gfo/Idh/MocA family oxidoreductase n=1 Tax=Aerophobetes bacterium TaxID=2030807 RepID=A0A662DGY5_UNCAE|nr:MAG: hypothetical protein DRI96_03055 [Candidatus Aerophobetes bacterium]HDN84936.1 Gfo/Idh/MocA family oxidoreductase [Candidatus Aerophobetes bacterium]
MIKMENKIGAAVIGVGRYGETHVRAYKKSPLVKLVAIWSRSEERAKKIGEKYNCEYTTNLEKIAQDKRVKIVSIATPDFAHTMPAIKMLRAGKHVLIEKPMAMSVDKCKKILKISRENNLKLMVNFHNRWYPPVVEAKRRLDRGEIGKVVAVYARLSDRVEVPTQWLLSWASKSGPQWFLFPHIIDLVNWLTGKQKVRRVYALGKKEVLEKRGIDTYDAVQAQVEFEETIAVFESSWILPSSWRNLIDFKIDLVGSQGKIEIVGDKEGINIVTEKYETPFVLDPITEEEPINYFIDCILNDKEPICSGKDGLEVTKIIEAIVKSLDKGCVVEVI